MVSSSVERAKRGRGEGYDELGVTCIEMVVSRRGLYYIVDGLWSDVQDEKEWAQDGLSCCRVISVILIIILCLCYQIKFFVSSYGLL